MCDFSGDQTRSTAPLRLTISVFVTFALCTTGCSWATDLILINTIDRKPNSTLLGESEKIRYFEEDFVRDHDQEAWMNRIREINESGTTPTHVN